MKQLVFVLWDSKAESYLRPFFLQKKGEALRMFQDLANDPQSEICKHAGDYTLMEIAEYDQETGVIAPYKTFKNWGTALEHKKAPMEPAAFQQPVKLAEANNA